MSRTLELFTATKPTCVQPISVLPKASTSSTISRQTTLDASLADFADASVDDDVVIFGTKPLSTGLRRVRWQVFVHFCGWGYLLIAVVNAFKIVTRTLQCSPLTIFWVMEAVIVAVLAAVCWLLPIFARRHAIRAWLVVAGLLQLARGVLAFSMFAQDVAVMSGLEVDNYNCSAAQMLSSVYWHGSLSVWSCFVTYVFIVAERHFINFIGGTSSWLGSSAIICALLGTLSVSMALLFVSIAILCGVAFAVSKTLRFRRIQSAREAIRADECAYNKHWSEVKDCESAAVSSLACVAAEIGRGLGPSSQHRVRQCTKSLDLLFADAIEINDNFQKRLQSIADRTGGRHVPTSIKGTQRALEKARRVYGDDGSLLVDLTRGSIVYDTVKGIENGLALFAQEVELVRLKNRFDPSYNSSATGGYRDMSINISFPAGSGMRSHVCEVQLQHKTLFALKSDGGHKRYIEFRNFSGN